MTTTTRRPQRLWAIFNPNGAPIIGHLSGTRSDSIESFMRLWDSARTNWRKLKREGFSCRKVTVRIEEGWS